MNYSLIVIALVILISGIYWWLPQPFGARLFYKGPKIYKINEKLDENEGY
jgi:hypothetical protein